MKILIVEDHTSSRLLLRKVLSKNGYDVIATSDGVEALKEFQLNDFDIIVTDWMMPNLDGIELIGKIREKKNPPPIIMLTALASESAKNKAMDAGADEYITKPAGNKKILESISDLIQRKKSYPKKNLIINPLQSLPKHNFWGITIAASTGGPLTLVKFFSNLKPISNGAIFIVLHAPDWMLKTFVARLQKTISMKVNLISEMIRFEPGQIYLAPGDYHSVINDSQSFNLLDTEPVNFVRPAADLLFQSVASQFGEKSIGIVLTGMGHDGYVGSGYIKAAGGFVIAQNPKEATISSMPKTVIDLKLADQICDIEKMGSSLNRKVNS